MKRGWFLLLALSVGLNAGLLYSVLSAPRDRGFLAPPPFIEQPGVPPLRPIGRPGAPSPPHEPDVPPVPETARRRLEEMQRRLQLDASQHEAMERVITETLPLILSARWEVQQARRDVHDAYRGRSPDPARVHESIRAMNRRQAILDSLVAEAMLKESALLDEDQMRRYFDWLRWGRPEPPPGPRR